MSYIGKNPKVDSVKLDGSATEPSGTAVDGQVYFNTGAGSISKGMKVYKNSQFVAIDKQLGDADTMQLLKAADIPAIDFSLSLTSTTVGGNNAVPFESSTGDFDGTAAFTNSSTGDALLTDDSADLVFHYTTQATNSADNDFWGIPLTVPRAFRGGNLVLEFKYRTEIATGTMDNGYFNIAIQDRSAMILQTQASTISAGAIAAGANVLLTGKTYANPVTSTTLTVAAGDRVFVESGTGTAGSQTNDIVDCYITSVSSTDNNVTLSKDIVAVQSGKFVTGWLTGYDTGGQIDAFASDTNKDGTSKKIAFKTDADTQQVSLWFFVKGTSTVKHELFFDNVLLSGNKFLQASSQTKNESYTAIYQSNFWDNSTSGYTFDASLLVAENGTPVLADSKLISVGDITGPGTTGTVTAITAKQDITLILKAVLDSASNGDMRIYNSNNSIVGFQGPPGTVALVEAHATVNLAKDDYLFCYAVNPYSRNGVMQIVAEPQTSPVVLLESQDEIFTSWTDYSSELSTTGPANETNTGTTGTYGTVTCNKAMWRRVGDTMEIQYNFEQSTLGGASTGEISIPLPNGYSIDRTKVVYGATAFAQVGYGKWSNNADGKSDATLPLTVVATNSATKETNVAWLNNEGSGGNVRSNLTLGSSSAGNTFNNCFQLWATFKVPIQGWNANFNPLLSLPLVDFSTWENNYTARIANNGTAASITSQASNFISSVSRSTTGIVAVTFTSGFFGVTPSVNVTVENEANSDRTINVYSVSTSGFTCSIEAPTDFGYRDENFNVVVGRQGSDYRQPPQPTAAVIKPAVAIGYEVYAKDTNGGNSTGGGYKQRKWNVWEGDTWFVSDFDGTLGPGGTTDTFSLAAGTYKVDGFTTAYKSNGSFSTMLSTDSSIEIFGTNGRPGSGDDVNVLLPFGGVITLTEKKAFQVWTWTATLQSTYGLGVEIGTSTSAVAGRPEKYCRIIIEKLK